MPTFDGTGPAGIGPKTGWGFGPCDFGLGWRKRFGAGRGMGRYFAWNWPQTNTDKLEALKKYTEALKEEIQDAEKEKKELQEE